MPLVASGYSNDAMAKHLFISEDTVKTHLRRLYRATGARDRAHLTTWAFLSGTLSVVREHGAARRSVAVAPLE